MFQDGSDERPKLNTTDYWHLLAEDKFKEDNMTTSETASSITPAQLSTNLPCKPKGRVPLSPTKRQTNARFYNTSLSWKNKATLTLAKWLTSLSIVVKTNEESAPIRSDSTLQYQFHWRNHDSNAATTRIGWIPQISFSFICLPLSGFTYSWTLSSKFFSTFPHGTCPLSDSWQYLALDGVYHPFWAAFPNNSTPRTTPRRWTVSLLRALHPLWAWATIRWTWSEL